MLLTACQDRTPPTPPTITLITPNPAQPGETVNVYGQWPSPPALLLDGRPVAATAGPGRLTVTLPAEMGAGLHELALDGGAPPHPLAINPRLDEMVIRNGQLILRGAGWLLDGKLMPQTQVWQSGLAVPFTLVGQDLVTEIPRNVSLAVDASVSVGEYRSRTRSTVAQASTLQGRVLRPATSSVQAAEPRLQAQQTRTSRHLIVRQRTGASTDLATVPGVTSVRTLPLLSAARLTFASASEAEAAIPILESRPDVLAVHLDSELTSDAQESSIGTRPNDLQAQTAGAQWFWPLLNVPQAQERTKGQGVTVAIIDTGVALDHPAFQGRILPGLDLLEGREPQDTVGHGTHVAGLIGAAGDVQGAAPGVSLLPVRVLDDTRGGSAYVVAQGILWAAGLLPDRVNPHPADIMNISLGTPDPDPVLIDAVRRALKAGVIVVAATGNNTGIVNYPAAVPGVIATTAVSGPRLTYQPSYADRGPGTAISAYGGDLSADQNADGVPDGILSTDVVNGVPGYALRQGTSMAAPQVTGIAALLLGSGTPRSQVSGLLLNTAVDLGLMGHDLQFGRGLVSARGTAAGVERTYALTLDEAGGVTGWTLVQPDGTYTLNDVRWTTRSVVIATDHNGNGLLAEPGELISARFDTHSAEGDLVQLPDLTLNPSTGEAPLRLP